MKLPTLTHLQFLVLDALGAQVRRGKDLRERLAEFGERRSSPAFYQMMARLEEAGFVEGTDRRATAGEYVVTERWYKVTGKGQRAWEDTRDFYISLAGNALAGKGARRS